MTTAIDAKILKKLGKQEKKEGHLSKSLVFYRKLLSIQSAVKRRISAPGTSLNKETANERITAGRPLLEYSDFVIDYSLLGEAFKEISALFAGYLKDSPEINAYLQSTPTVTEEVIEAWFKGSRLPLPGKADDTTEAIWELIIHASIKPFLVKYRETLYDLIPQEFWRRGYCPLCGGRPDFAYLDKERGSRWLLCSRCDTEWLFQRLECPYCGTRDQNALSYLTDDKGFYRLYVCEKCRQYVKVIDLRQTEEEILLPLERLLTTDMDIQAQEEGYTLSTKGTGVAKTRQNDATLSIKEDS